MSWITPAALLCRNNPDDSDVDAAASTFSSAPGHGLARSARKREGGMIVLLYNDRDSLIVRAICRELTARLRGTDIMPWMAYEHLTAWGDIFEQIEDAIATAIGAVVFLGQHGMGRFQRNIEVGAVDTEIWQRGAQYGRLLVHLEGGLDVPRPLLRWPTVNHDGSLAGAAELADGIIARFGLAPSLRKAAT